jgi:putative transposase
MPRQSRLDAPGLLHHVMTRGLERGLLFRTKDDYEDFLTRLEESLKRSPNEILAWSLMPNHVHLLVRSGPGGITGLMRRVMSGYAVAFNARHRRVGYLFQNRYKSIVCEEEPYLLELVRYIHLNPVRARIVRSVESLAGYAYTGHSALMGRVSRPWQETEEVLERFGKGQKQARKRYEAFIRDGVGQGERPDLLGGGLLRSQGGARGRREEDRVKSDERILGSGNFVDRVLKEAERKDDKQRTLRARGWDLRKAAKEVRQRWKVEERALFRRDRRKEVSRAKAVLIYLGVEYLGKTAQEMAGLTRMSVPAACKAKVRGAALIEASDWSLPKVN